MNKVKSISIISIVTIFSLFILKLYLDDKKMKNKDLKADCFNGTVTLYKLMNGSNYLKEEIYKVSKDNFNILDIENDIKSGLFLLASSKIASLLRIKESIARKILLTSLGNSWKLLEKMNTESRIKSFNNQGIDLMLYSLTGNTELAKKHKLYHPSCILLF